MPIGRFTSDVWLGAEPLKNAKLGDALLPLVAEWDRAAAGGAGAVLDALEARFAFEGVRFERRGDALAWWRTDAWDEAAPAERRLLVTEHDTHDGHAGLAIAWAAAWSCGGRSAYAVVTVGDAEAANARSRAALEEIARGAGAAFALSPGSPDDRIVTERRGLVRVTTHDPAIAARARALVDPARAISAHVTADAVELRFAWPQDQAALVAALALADRRDVPIVTRPPMTKAAGTGALAERYGRAAGVDGPRPDEAPMQELSSTANLIAALGVPTLDGLGPIAGAGADSLGKRARALIRVLRNP